MFLLCALSLAGEWRSANIDMGFKRPVIPYSETIPLPRGSRFAKPIELKMNVQTDSATYTYNKTIPEAIIKTIVHRFGVSGYETDIRELDSVQPENLVMTTSTNISGSTSDKERHTTKTVVKLDYQVLDNGMRRIKATSAKCSATLHVDMSYKVAIPWPRPQVVLMEVPRTITHSEAKAISRAMDRVIAKHVNLRVEPAKQDSTVHPK